MKLCGWLVLACAMLPLPSPAQQESAHFEVASIKPTPNYPPYSAEDIRAGRRRPMGMSIDGARVDIREMTLQYTLGQAFKVRPIYVLGEDWLANTKFDIAATIPEGRTKQDVPDMLQVLLVERFRLRAHREMRDMPVYALVQAKSGAKLKEVPADTPDAVKNSPDSMVIVGAVTAVGAAGSFAGLRLPVVNATGLEGKYEMPLDPGIIFGGIGSRNPNSLEDDVDGFERMNQALDPLGLKLERRKVPTDVIIVDHIEHTPTEN
jgi:uncharacterized protein (TIGR03435 family)